MPGRRAILHRIRSHTRLSDEAVAEIDRRLASEQPAREVLAAAGLSPAQIQAVLQSDDDPTLQDLKVPMVTTLARIDEPSVDDLVGRLLDVTNRFEIQGEIARGAMGRILAGWDLHLGRAVAIKVLRREAPRDLDRVRFLEEAQVTGQLQHPNIMPVYELGRIRGQLAFVMRRIEGRSLKNVIAGLRKKHPEITKQFGRMRLLAIFNQVCLAVAFAHSRGVVHRDLKPSNVMLGDFGEVLLLDWGLCKIIGQVTRSTRSTMDRWRTVQGQIIGTPAYMAPEQAMGRIDEVDARTDVYGLGAILYHLLALVPPVTGKTNREIVRRVLRETVPSMLERAPDRDIPPAIDAIVMRCLARDPAERFPNARALSEAVSQYLDERPQGEAPRSVEALVAEGVAAIAEQQSLFEDAALVRDTLQEAWAAVAPGSPPAQKKVAWRAENELRALEVRMAEAFARASGALERAVALDPKSSEAVGLLCDLFLARHERALMLGEHGNAAYYRQRVANIHDGRHQALVAGEGTLQIEGNVGGGGVWLWALSSRNRRLVHDQPEELGALPRRIEGLKAGCYQITAKAPGHEPFSTTVRVMPGESARIRIQLLPEGAVADGYVHVPQGTFRFGHPEGAFALPSVQALPDYLVARYPVTSAAYLEFINELAELRPDEAAARIPRTADGLHAAWPQEGGRYRLPAEADGLAWGPDLPVVGVRATDALAYCAWRSDREGFPVRLPVEEEWEKAGRGAEGRCFPWGFEWEATYMAGPDTCTGPLPPVVGHCDGDRSPYGVMDLAGGVREWTSTLEPGGGQARHVVRGGSFLIGSGGSQPLWSRTVLAADRRAPDLGFRLVRDPLPGESF